jgi:hypothetical protein
MRCGAGRVTRLIMVAEASMGPTAIDIVTSIITIVVSVCTSMFVSGTRWGRVEATLADLEKDRVRTADITGLRDRLSRIEGMFTLTLRDSERRG